MNTHATQPPMLSESDMMRLRRFQETCDDDGSHDIGKVAIEQLVEAGALRSTSSGRHRVTAFGSWLLSNVSLPSVVNESTDFFPFHDGKANVPPALASLIKAVEAALLRFDLLTRDRLHDAAQPSVGFAELRTALHAFLETWSDSNSTHAHDKIDVAAAPRLPAGWSLTLRPDQSIRLTSPNGNAWGFEESRGSGTGSAFVHEFLLALATDLGPVGA